MLLVENLGSSLRQRHFSDMEYTIHLFIIQGGVDT